MILDGRPGFGTAIGTARRLSNSTFIPGRGGGTPAIQAGILVTGSKAVASFDQVHVETPSGADSNFEVTNGATVSVVGPTQFGNTIVHLTSSGTGIMVKNVSAASGNQVIKDDVDGVNNLSSYVANYSSSLQAGTLRAFTSLTLPSQNANLIYAGPSSGPPAAPTFRSMVAADLPTAGTVQVLAGGLSAVASTGTSTYVGWLGGTTSTSATGLSPVIASGGTISGLFVGVSATYANAVTFTVASCTPSGMANCTPTDGNLHCTISGTSEQCNDTSVPDAVSVSAGDEVFLHLTTTGTTIPGRTVFMSYRLTGVQ
jgi:hypothetical protein